MLEPALNNRSISVFVGAVDKQFSRPSSTENILHIIPQPPEHVTTVCYQDTESNGPTKPSSLPILSLSEVIVMDNLKEPPDTVATENCCQQFPRSETRKSKMRLKNYFQRCKEALIGTPTEENCPITHQSSTSWYLDENTNKTNNTNKSENTERTLIIAKNNGQPNVIQNEVNNMESKQIELGHEKSSTSNRINQNENMNEELFKDFCNDKKTIIEIVADGKNRNKPESNFSINCAIIEDNHKQVESLVDKYLSHLYPDYEKCGRNVLVRQATYLLNYTFDGKLDVFEKSFMIPAAHIVEVCHEKYIVNKTNIWQDGWPLCIQESVILHLGPLDENLLLKSDIYICIRPSDTKTQLCAVWRTASDKIIYHTIDPNKDNLTPLTLDMLGEDLPTLLQTLLVGFEHQICRISLDDISSFGPERKHISSNGERINENGQKKSQKNTAIKRRDTITKNKTFNSKYNLKRMNSSLGATDEIALKNDSKDNAGSPLDPSSMPLFCLGGSFPHIDSDEDSCEDSTIRKFDEENQLPQEIVAPRTIQEVPVKLISSGIYLPGTHDNNGIPLITVEADKVIAAGLNCYEIATVLLYYSTIPLRPTAFNLLIYCTNKNNQTHLTELLDNSINLIKNHIKIEVAYVFVNSTNPCSNSKNSNVKVIAINKNNFHQFINDENLPEQIGGTFNHNQTEWKDFFSTLEPMNHQCLAAGKRLVQILSEIWNSDAQGEPNRRQLHSQHRALSRALMDTELQNLRRTGHSTLLRLQERARRINNRLTLKDTKNNNENVNCEQNEQNAEQTQMDLDNDLKINNTTFQDFAKLRLNELSAVFNEVDRVVKRLEALTDQRRERLRELTRQKEIEEEINEVVTWIMTDGEQSIKKYSNIALDIESTVKENEVEFEKFYFISMKMIAKGRDLQDAASETLQSNISKLKKHLKSFNERLEILRERFEDALRLHQLIATQVKEQSVHSEMRQLAEKLDIPSLTDKCKSVMRRHANVEVNETTIINHSDDKTNFNMKVSSWNNNEQNHNLSSMTREERLNTSKDSQITVEEDEEDHSKMADSGLGSCDRCEGNEKLTRTCSCQSLDDPNNACFKSNNSDDLDEDCFQSAKQSLDLQVPLQANAHLYCHASSLQLDLGDISSIFDQKTQKTLLLIMREMIGTERDYVRSLHYVIENYINELMREDIPQALRGQRNVIFGNIERIYDFHQQLFLKELELYERNPVKVGAAFLRHESKFYLYALYNKNKPKSDSLMSEYGSQFFKSKQIELKDKMDLASYLLKPVQRMGKYALLLQQLMKACQSVENVTSQEFIEDLEELQRADEMVRFQLRHGNDLLAMDSLRDCDVNLKEQGRLLRQNEFLVWEGRGGRKSLRQVFLFEELVLFSKARRFPDRKNLDIYIYKHSIKTSDIGLTAHVSDSPTKFEIWFRKRKPCDTYTLQSMSTDVKNAWTDEISKLLWQQAKRNREVRMAEMSSMGIGSKPCLDIRPSEDQINDRSISISQLGKAPKFRNSFIGLPPSESSASTGAKRPNSIISVSSGSSGGSSASTTGSSSGNSSIDTRNKSINNLSGVDTLNSSIISGKHFKSQYHKRSTTLTSQCSMESGIISDMCLSPDDISDNAPVWPSTTAIPMSNLVTFANVVLRKTNYNSVEIDSSSKITDATEDNDIDATNFDKNQRT
uniref:CSON003678 protein n=1 Tax=Culicoides sonorensis TaxID=179676 RepID=A0A336K1P8_CULSO